MFRMCILYKAVFTYIVASCLQVKQSRIIYHKNFYIFWCSTQCIICALNNRINLRHSFTFYSFSPQMTSRDAVQNCSKMASRARLHVRYCIMVPSMIQFNCIMVPSIFDPYYDIDYMKEIIKQKHTKVKIFFV